MRISLKIKLLLLLVSLSVFILIAFATVSLNDFIKDKMAYVFDSTLSHTTSTSVQLRTDLEYSIERFKFLIRGFNSEQGKLHPYSIAIFEKEPSLEWMAVYSYNNSNGSIDLNQAIKKRALDSEDDDKYKLMAPELSLVALKDEVSLKLLDDSNNKWALAIRTTDIVTKKQLFIVGVFTKGNFVENFVNSKVQDTFLVNEKNEIIARPQRPVNIFPEDKINLILKEASAKITGLQGISEIALDKKGDDSLLTSLSQVGIGGLRVVSFVPKSSALEAVKFIKMKAGFFLLLLIFITVVISILSAGKLTANLNKLVFATDQIADGDFSINLNVKSKDEMGKLSTSFTKMANEIQRLLAETAEKSRMENELKTAQLVQSTLFPDPEYMGEGVHILGYYEPASECGGDWWYHSHIQGKTILWIGDATGHGVPAALVTAAARSAANVVEQMETMKPAQIMQLLNSAIHSTARGHVLMTFFLAVFDPDTRELVYTNASHDPPFYFSSDKSELKKKDIIPLNENTGNRLGEGPDNKYSATSMTLKPGDRIVFYTDGVTELKNPEDDMLGERNFIKSLLESYNNGSSLQDSMHTLNQQIADFRDGHPLEDDVTYFMFEVI